MNPINPAFSGKTQIQVVDNGRKAKKLVGSFASGLALSDARRAELLWNRYTMKRTLISTFHRH